MYYNGHLQYIKDCNIERISWRLYEETDELRRWISIMIKFTYSTITNCHKTQKKKEIRLWKQTNELFNENILKKGERNNQQEKKIEQYHYAWRLKNDILNKQIEKRKERENQEKRKAKALKIMKTFLNKNKNKIQRE